MTNCRCIAGFTSRWKMLRTNLGVCPQNNDCPINLKNCSFSQFFSRNSGPWLCDIHLPIIGYLSCVVVHKLKV